MTATRARGFTGWHMLAVMLAFFGTIITVNVTMAFLANSSWSGMLSKNTYVASQDFNKNAARAREWARLGFGGELTIKGGVVRYRLAGPADVVAAVDRIEATFRRPVGEKQDFVVKLVRGDGVFSAPQALAAGPWVVDLAAMRGGELVFHEAERIISEGN
ncbi:FixH family protein [Rhizobium sp.]